MSQDSSKTCPYDQANILSKLSFWWMNALFKHGSKNLLTSFNICEVPKHDESNLLHSKLDSFWREEVQRYSEGRNASLLRAILQAFRWQWILPALLAITLEGTYLVQPYIIGLIVTYVNEDGDAVSTETAYGVGASLLLTAVLQTSVSIAYLFNMHRVSIRMKIAIRAIVFRKIMLLSSESLQMTSAQQIIDLLSEGFGKFDTCLDGLHYLLISPVSVTVVMFLVYQQVGLVSLCGLAIVLAVVLLQAGLAVISARIRQKIVAHCDRRVQLTSEILAAIKIVKVSCLEQSVQSLISQERRSELSLMRWRGTVLYLANVAEIVLPRLALFVIVMLLGHTDHGSAQVLTTLAWFWVLQHIVQRFPVGSLQEVLRFGSAAKLIQDFLLLGEEKEQIKDLRMRRSIYHLNDARSDWAIDIDHMTARWPQVFIEGRRQIRKKKHRSSTSSTKSLLHESDLEHTFSLKYVSLRVLKGELLAIVGIPGSGKSSLLMCLLGELPYEIGQISVNGRISFCGQSNWVFSGTVRDNILFGQPFHQAHYERVLESCGLVQDLHTLPRGDQTFVGDRGLELNTGQRARLALARCVYHPADIYLLDDPLRDLDTSVGQHIFHRCVRGVLKEKTVVLVTQQLHYLKQVDRILVLRDGSIYDIGTYEELKSRGINLRSLILDEPSQSHPEGDIKPADQHKTKFLLQDKFVGVNEEKSQEDMKTSQNSFSVFWRYFRAGFGPAFLPVLLPLWILSTAFYFLSDWMLAQWLTDNKQQRGKSLMRYNATDQSTLIMNIPETSTSNPNSGLGSVSWYWYVVGLGVGSLAYLVYPLVFVQVTTIAGQRLHDKILALTLNAVTSFFDQHSLGQVVSTFSRHLGVVDRVVSPLCFLIPVKTAICLGCLLMTAVANPWLAIALVPVLVFIVWLWKYAAATVRQLHGLEETAQCPMYSHIWDTVWGLKTIRALNKQQQFLAEFDHLQDRHTAASFLCLGSHSWLCLRGLAVVLFYICLVIFLCLSLKQSMDGNLAGLSLIYCMFLPELVGLCLRSAAELEARKTSLEKVFNCRQLQQEAAKLSDKPPSPDWPNRGAITLNQISLQYSPDSPLALKNIECHIKGREKIGITGPPYAGKTSLISALFRLAPPTGIIHIDGVDVGKLGLHELRSKICLIPSQPALFSQTLRWNLDPGSQFSDEQLWHALEQVHLKAKVETFPDKLDTNIQDGTYSLASGQIELFYLARALLKNNRILIVDEASMALDQETDAIFQKTLRAKFRESTVITISSRLYDIMDCDRIMVLEAGELKEFDSPYNLLQASDGVFTRLVLNTGKNSAKQLKALAEFTQHKRTSASIQLHRAMLLANEQLAHSTEDLSANRAALSWNRFTHSQDSLDKVLIENIFEKEKKSVAPSQKIISRRSPARGKKPREEQQEEPSLKLLSSTVEVVSPSSNKDRGHGSNSGINQSGQQDQSSGRPSLEKSGQSPSASHQIRFRSGGDSIKKETDIDSFEESLVEPQVTVGKPLEKRGGSKKEHLDHSLPAVHQNRPRSDKDRIKKETDIDSLEKSLMDPQVTMGKPLEKRESKKEHINYSQPAVHQNRPRSDKDRIKKETDIDSLEESLLVKPQDSKSKLLEKRESKSQRPQITAAKPPYYSSALSDGEKEQFV